MRRAHQISVSIFMEETAALGVTTTQYGAMFVLKARGRLDQTSLSQLIGIDRSTTALVVRKLAERGYVDPISDPKDRRRKSLTLTPLGNEVLEALKAPAQRASEQALSVFTAPEQKTLLRLLKVFVDSFNYEARAPIIADDDQKIQSRRVKRQRERRKVK